LRSAESFGIFSLGFDSLLAKCLALQKKVQTGMYTYPFNKHQRDRQLRRDPKYKIHWDKSAANGFGRLADGVGNRVKGTKTIEFIRKCDVPQARMEDVTYGSFVCSVQNEKAEKNRTRFLVGGDRINYPGEVATPTVELLVAKLLFNSVISTKGAQFMTMDISNFCLMTPLV
jgi:hypothetical protein